MAYEESALEKSHCKIRKIIPIKSKGRQESVFRLSDSAFDAREFKLDVERQNRLRCPTVSQKKAGIAKTFFWCTAEAFVGRQQILLYNALFCLYKGGVSLNATFDE